MTYDITILTDSRYVKPKDLTAYIQNVLDEDRLVAEALERKGLKVYRCAWDDPEMNWENTSHVLFRSTWDYFDRYDEFSKWLDEVQKKTVLLNPKELIHWNVDKRYLKDLECKGVRIPATVFIDEGHQKKLSEIVEKIAWDEFILKPAISGAARHTYRFTKKEIGQYESIFQQLIANEAMLLQEYQKRITTDGEVSFMVFGGEYSHAILKKAKAGDFRVQDDFGGSIHHYEATNEEKDFAEAVVATCTPLPIYARVDAMWDNDGDLCVSEVELIEPELWFRMNDKAADKLATALMKKMA